MPTALQFGQGLQLPCYLYEGVVTTREIYETSGKVKGYDFSVEISKGDIVQIWEQTKTGDTLVVKAADVDVGDPGEGTLTQLGSVGIVITEPELIKIPASSPFTQSDAVDMRRATVEWFGFSAVRKVTVVEANVAGTPLGYDASAGQFTSATASVSFRPYVLVESSSAGGSAHILM